MAIESFQRYGKHNSTANKTIPRKKLADCNWNKNSSSSRKGRN